LLDLNIPKISELQVLTHFRSGRRFSKVPVVIVTSSNSPADLAAIQEMKASAYFRKPTDRLTS
jgi:CheY-like chemotaxis protein